MQRLALLGSTGSIGTCTLDIIESLKDRFELYGIAANTNVQRISEQVEKFKPRVVVIGKDQYPLLKEALSDRDLKILVGVDGLCELSGDDEVDLVLNATVGSVGLLPTLEAIRTGKKIAMANKETIVAFGPVLMQQARETGALIIPVDSEHSAIHQCLADRNSDNIRRIVLTASGGPFFNATEEVIQHASRETVLAHPVWQMGAKVTVDSATLMNKGFEVIEAHYLFNIPIEKIDVMVHPQALVHSMVEFEDGSMLAQIATPDMRVPIQYALTFPERFPSTVEPCDLTKVERLEFREVDVERFPCLELGYSAVRKNGTATAVLCGADEVVVNSFLEEQLRFKDIPFILNKILTEYKPIPSPTLDQLIEEEKWAKDYTRRLIDRWTSR